MTRMFIVVPTPITPEIDSVAQLKKICLEKELLIEMGIWFTGRQETNLCPRKKSVYGSNKSDGEEVLST